MDQLKAVRYFLAVAELGSFSAAARLYSKPASSISRRIADLEASLGTLLLKRNTRQVQLTELGRRYQQQMLAIVSDFDVIHEAIRQAKEDVAGTLTISCMVGYGEKKLLPLLDQFRDMYPDIVVDLRLSDELSSFSRDDVDIAIRGGYAPNERVVARRLSNNHFVALAAPSYLQRQAPITDAFTLKEHQGLLFQSPKGPLPWLCQSDDQWHDVTPKPSLISNNGAWLAQRAVAGDGIIMLPRWAVAEQLEQGLLVELTISPKLTISRDSDFGIFLLYQRRRYQLPKIKVAVDFFCEQLTELPLSSM